MWQGSRVNAIDVPTCSDVLCYHNNASLVSSLQDGAPPHYELVSRGVLNRHFDMWLGQNGTDLSVMDYTV